MRTQSSLSLLPAITGVLVLSTCLVVFTAQAAQAGDAGPSFLQRAVGFISSDPAKAAQMLKQSDKPTAYAYLAYLYMTNKVKIPNRSQTIDALMSKAIHSKLIDDAGAFGDDIEEQTKYHYDNLGLLLRHLRCVSDASYSTSPDVPVSIFKEYPREAFEAFTSLWGSRRDSYLNTTWDRNESLKQIPGFEKLNDLNSEILGDPGSNCTGTIVYGHLRRIALAKMRVCLAPKVFLAGKSQEESEGGSDRQIKEFLEHWSNLELWNKTKWRKWNETFLVAEPELANYYVRNFALSPADAKKAAGVALWHVTSVYLSIFSGETLTEQICSPVYRCFTKEQLSLEQMNQALAGKKLTADEATEALTYAILNNSKLEVIDELIRLGANLNPVAAVGTFEGGESALFSAVLRPEVAERLLKAGANVDYQNMVGKTALIQAIQYDAFDTIKLLLAAGAKLNEGMFAADGDAASKANDSCFYNYSVGKRTPLMYACAFASAKVINHLLDAGADKKARDSKDANAESFLKDNALLSDAEKKAIVARLQ